MNPSTAFARVLVDELVRGGVRDAVLSPGSRNAPLSYALYDADAAGRLRLHVRIDERTGAYLALGLAKAGGVPVPVVTTSGTAAANLHPAVVEASHAGVPLLALTADRPAELRGTGANQTIDQLKLYGDAVRSFVDAGTPERRPGQNAPWRSLVCRTLAVATGALTGDPGPVHLNLPLRDPLVPDVDDDWPEALDGRLDGRPWTSVPSPSQPDPLAGYPGAPRTLVLVGACHDRLATAAARIARERGWPLVAEPVSPARPAALAGGSLVLGAADLAGCPLRPDRILAVGRLTLTRAAQALLRTPGIAVDVVGDSPRWSDPAGIATSVLAPGGVPDPPAGPLPDGDTTFLARWQQAAACAREAAESLLAAEPVLAGPHVARAVSAAVAPGGLLVLGSSSVVRDVDLVGTLAPGARPLANRGAAGIDGTISTAVGAALTLGRTSRGAHGGTAAPAEQQHALALMGDLTFLHDATGLVIGPHEARPNVTIVVVNDDGGGIFTLLEHGAPEHTAAFERVFGTPTGVDLAALCAATGTPHSSVADEQELGAALTPAAGIRVVEVRTDRSSTRALHARLRSDVKAALARAW